MNIKVSVIIAAYNVENFISKAIESVLQQTINELEIIVVDDASSDATVDVIKKYSYDKRIRLIELSTNRGPSFCRNYGISEAKGEWIAVLDSDDWMDTKRLSKMLEVATSNDADIVVDDLNIVNEGTEIPWCTHFSLSGKKAPKQIELIDCISFIQSDMPGERGLRLGLAKPIIKRSFLQKYKLKYNNDIHFAEDFHLYFRCLINGAKFVIMPDPYYFYIKRRGSLTSKERLTKLYLNREVNLKLLHLKDVKTNKTLVDIIKKRDEKFIKQINYQIIINKLKKKNIIGVISEIYENPKMLFYLIFQIPRIISNKIVYKSSNN